MKKKIVKDFKNILVVQTAFLGDLVLTTPLFRALKRLYPAARLTLLTTPQAAGLVEADPHLDAILLYDKKGREPLLAAARKVRAGDFDLLLAPHRSHRTSLLGFLSEIPVRVGYREAGFSFLYTRKVERPKSGHEVDRILALLTALGAAPLPADRVLACECTEAERAEVAGLLRASGVTEGEKLAGLCPGSVWATKRWPAENYAELAKRLTAAGFRVVLVGGPDDREVAERVLAQAGPGVVDGVGQTPLKALPAWLERMSLFVTNDSAPLHVAAAKDVPTVALFGPTVKLLGFYPFHLRSRVVEVALECRPCGLHGHDRCPRGHFRCMREITPDAVIEACREVLGCAEEARRLAGCG